MTANLTLILWSSSTIWYWFGDHNSDYWVWTRTHNGTKIVRTYSSRRWKDISSRPSQYYQCHPNDYTLCDLAQDIENTEWENRMISGTSFVCVKSNGFDHTRAQCLTSWYYWYHIPKWISVMRNTRGYIVQSWIHRSLCGRLDPNAGYCLVRPAQSDVPACACWRRRRSFHLHYKRS